MGKDCLMTDGKGNGNGQVFTNIGENGEMLEEEILLHDEFPDCKIEELHFHCKCGQIHKEPDFHIPFHLRNY